MKTLHALLFSVAAATALQASAATKSYVLSFKDGSQEIFSTDMVDSMIVSRTGIDGKVHDTFVSQEIWSGGKVTRFDLASLEGIHFADISVPEPADHQVAIKSMTDSWLKLDYLSPTGSSTDDYLIPLEWTDGGWGPLLYAISTDSYKYSIKPPVVDTENYAGLLDAIESTRKEIDAGDKSRQTLVRLAELRFVRALYLFRQLQFFGPIPICETVAELSDPNVSRRHYDYCVAWLARELDEAAELLPATRHEEQRALPTSTAAKALKGRLLLTAASPLWNGAFPWPDWQNSFETPADPSLGTPDYGYLLVADKPDPEKWQRALEANLEALEVALTKGQRRLLTDATDAIDPSQLPFIPFDCSDDFKRKVMLMRLLNCSGDDMGNHEAIMQTDKTGNWLTASLPHSIITLSDYTHPDSYNGVAPTLNAIKSFNTVNGLLPANDPSFAPESEWFESAGVEGRERKSIINLCNNREPRFYAWMAFDGGDYGTVIADGEPLTLQLRKKWHQGYWTPARDYSPTGFLTQKFIDPYFRYYKSGSSGNIIYDYNNLPRFAFLRLAELYLNIAECHAALGNDAEALEYMNVVRERTGVPALTDAMATASGMSVMEWVRNERFIEFWGEQMRFHDIRRWVKGNELLGRGVRKGLNARVEDPTMEEFNRPTDPEKGMLSWSDRHYVYPYEHRWVSGDDKEYNAIVQSPGWPEPLTDINRRGVIECSIEGGGITSGTVTLPIRIREKGSELDSEFNLLITEDALAKVNEATGKEYTMVKAESLKGLSLGINRMAVTTETSSIEFDINLDNYPMGSFVAVPFEVELPEYSPLEIRGNAFGAILFEKSVIKSCSSNDKEPSEGTVESLFDHNPGTHYHSTWSEAVTEEMHHPVYGSFIEAEIAEEVSSLSFDLTTRYANNTGAPSEVHLYVSPDGESWTLLDKITGMLEQLTGGNTTGHWGEFRSATPFRHIRFCVIESKQGKLTEINNAYWNAAELNMKFSK